ncbi:DUF3159 domain-containing protein [Georgenia sp. MJ173]|uniref:DUF3159 domain-containing protein n=1 Tax=Georgenia sunbinii TaxID=3117728 RepID=UPI002F26CE06
MSAPSGPSQDDGVVAGAEPAAAGAEPTTAGAAPGGGGLRQVVGEDFSLAESIGGVRGLIESVLPGLVFVVVYIITRELAPPLVASLAVALVLVVVRLVGGTPVTQALGGILGVGIGVFWAWRSGEAQDFYVFGLLTNAAYAVVLLVSIAVRWPVIGIIVSLLRQEGFGWRTDPALQVRRRRYYWGTWLWVGLFGARLAVQLPLYLDASVGWLGTARLVMGVPLWALALWATWVLVREPAAVAAPRDQPTG